MIMAKKLSLDGIWQMSETSGEYRNISARLPGDNYSALIAAGICPDPYWSDNEKIIQHFRFKNWSFERKFVLPDDFMKSSFIILELAMVDTFCNISVNGHPVCFCDNCYAKYTPEIKRFLHAGENSLHLDFLAVDGQAEKIAGERGRKFRQCGYCKIPNLNQVRKPICSGGWDWGISLAANGVYDPIILRGINNSYIRDLYTVQKHQENRVSLTAVAEIYAAASSAETVLFKFNGEEHPVPVTLQPGINRVKSVFTVDSPRLWWPNGSGNAELYELSASTAEDHLHRRIGLRSIEVINEPDEYGSSFYFRINGKNIFAKGANWIPCDALPGRMTAEKYDDLLTSAKNANMNIIRIWGGGFYEKDVFYDLCDEKGLLVWQDMMFSVSEYPADDEFIASVEAELEYQITRLRHHASLALWCGDNECFGCFKRTEEEKETWLKEYTRLNSFLGSKAAALDPERTFWPSSPCGGPGSTSDNWHDDRFGDMHYWDVWHGGKEFSAYYSIKPRFCSEFGYQSFPSLETVKSFCPADQLDINSPAITYHQKHRLGNQPIINMFERYFNKPAGLKNFLYLSQVQQALAIKTGVEFWRTLKPRCMGAIFWQFNDNWPVASWSSIEYGGKWKLLNYEAKRFYAPVISSVYKDENGAYLLYIVSDLIRECRVDVKIEKRHISGALLEKKNFLCTLPENGTLPLIADCCKEFAVIPEENFLEIYLQATGADGRLYTHRNSAFFVPFKALTLPEAAVTAQSAMDGEKYVITLSSSGTALFTALDLPGCRGVFSDNNFTLLPDEQREVVFTPAGKYSEALLNDALEIYHLKAAEKA